MAADIAYVGTKMSNLATAFNANDACNLGNFKRRGATQRFPVSAGTSTSTLTLGAAPITGCKPALTRRLLAGTAVHEPLIPGPILSTIRTGPSAQPAGADESLWIRMGNPLLNLNKGSADQDIRHNFVFSSLYELPFGKGKQFAANVPTALDYVIGGWQWNNIVTLQTGTPIDLSVKTIAPNNRPDLSGPISVRINHATGLATVSGNFTDPGNYAAGNSRAEFRVRSRLPLLGIQA